MGGGIAREMGSSYSTKKNLHYHPKKKNYTTTPLGKKIHYQYNFDSTEKKIHFHPTIIYNFICLTQIKKYSISAHDLNTCIFYGLLNKGWITKKLY